MLKRIQHFLTLELRAIGRAPITFVTSVVVCAVLISAGVFWSLRQETTLLRQQVAEYRDKLSGASAEDAKTALNTLADEVSALQARLKPRRVTPTQLAMLEEHLKLTPGAQHALAIVHEGGCWDCPQYAADFDAAFRSIPGWRVSNRVVMGLVQRPAHGLAVVLVDPSHPSPQEAAVLQALRAAQIEFDMQQAYPASDGSPQLLLSARLLQ
jgi:hypothetical protein